MKKNWIGRVFLYRLGTAAFCVDLALFAFIWNIVFTGACTSHYSWPGSRSIFFIRAHYIVFSSTYVDCRIIQLELHLGRVCHTPHSLTTYPQTQFICDKIQKKSNKNTGNLEIWCIVNTILNVSSVLLQFTCTTHAHRYIVKCMPENIYISIGIVFFFIRFTFFTHRWNPIHFLRTMS